MHSHTPFQTLAWIRSSCKHCISDVCVCTERAREKEMCAYVIVHIYKTCTYVEPMQENCILMSPPAYFRKI